MGRAGAGAGPKCSEFGVELFQPRVLVLQLLGFALDLSDLVLDPHAVALDPHAVALDLHSLALELLNPALGDLFSPL